jgi:hypothetical protein
MIQLLFTTEKQKGIQSLNNFPKQLIAPSRRVEQTLNISFPFYNDEDEMGTQSLFCLWEQ